MQGKHILPIFAVLLAPVVALGINCRGSSNCAGAPGNIQGVLSAVESVNQGMTVSVVSFGILLKAHQNGASGTAADAANHIHNLINHGCNKCGSDPTQPGNNVDTGELTVNWVISP